MRRERDEQLLSGVDDVAGAEREHQVAGAHARRQAATTSPSRGRNETGPPGRSARYASTISLPVTPGSGSSRAGKISVTMASSASVSAWPNSRCRYRVREYRCGWNTAITRPWPPRLRGRERGRDLRGVVRVVVDDLHTAVLALELVAAGGAAERQQVRRRVLRRDPGVAQHRERRERVEHVVLARHPQLHPGERLAAPVAQGEDAAAVVDTLDLGAQVAAPMPTTRTRAGVCAARASPPLPATSTSRPSAGSRATNRRKTSCTSSRQA